MIDDGFQEGSVKALEQFEWTFAAEPLVLYRPDVDSQHTRLTDERPSLLEAWRPDETDAVRRREREAAPEEDARTPRAVDTVAAGARASGEPWAPTPTVLARSRRG